MVVVRGKEVGGLMVGGKGIVGVKGLGGLA